MYLFHIQYIRIPFTPTADSSNDKSSSIDHIENDTKQKTLAECIADLIRYGWKLPSPQLIISVTGGARLFKLSTPRARYAFQRGLVAAAVTTGE
jgi:hypothetical protein